MGARLAPEPAGPGPTHEPLVSEFAGLMRQRYKARVYLFGSRTRGTTRADSDYDLVAVADAFAAQPLLARALDRGQLWRQAGGWGIALDLHCYTPAEFRAELKGLGYLGQAKARGELLPVRPRNSTDAVTAGGATDRGAGRSRRKVAAFGLDLHQPQHAWRTSTRSSLMAASISSSKRFPSG